MESGERVTLQWRNLADVTLTMWLTTRKACWYHMSPDTVWGEGHLTSGVFFPQIHNPSLIMRNIWQSLRDILQNTWQVPFKSQGHEKTRKDWETVTEWRRLKKHDNYTQCRILCGILERKTDMSGKTGEIQIKSVINSVVPVSIP